MMHIFSKNCNCSPNVHILKKIYCLWVTKPRYILPFFIIICIFDYNTFGSADLSDQRLVAYLRHALFAAAKASVVWTNYGTHWKRQLEDNFASVLHSLVVAWVYPISAMESCRSGCFYWAMHARWYPAASWVFWTASSSWTARSWYCCRSWCSWSASSNWMIWAIISVFSSIPALCASSRSLRCADRPWMSPSCSRHCSASGWHHQCETSIVSARICCCRTCCPCSRIPPLPWLLSSCRPVARGPVSPEIRPFTSQDQHSTHWYR